MANGDDELYDTDPDGPGADGLEVDEHDTQGNLRAHDRTLTELIQRGEQAGFGGQTGALRAARKALRRTKQYVAEAEERGRQRALEEFAAGNEQAVTALRDQVRAELATETSRERSFARLGLGPDSPVRALFADVQGDHAAFERHAALLHAGGIRWDDAPLVRQVAAQQLQAATQAATQAHQNGQVDLGQPGVPDQVRDRLVAEAVGQMAGAASGAVPPGAQTPLEATVEKGQRRPELLESDNYRDSLVTRANQELDGLAQALRGGAWQ